MGNCLPPLSSQADKEAPEASPATAGPALSPCPALAAFLASQNGVCMGSSPSPNFRFSEVPGTGILQHVPWAGMGTSCNRTTCGFSWDLVLPVGFLAFMNSRKHVIWIEGSLLVQS